MESSIVAALCVALMLSGCSHEARNERKGKVEPGLPETPSEPENTGSSTEPAPKPSPLPKPAPLPSPTPSPVASPRSIGSPVYGVTIDGIDNLPSILESVRRLSRKATVRVVFDELVPATHYRDAVTRLHEVGFVMGELLDSYYVKKYTVDQYRQRAEEYVDLLGPQVDLWEIGNEINGEWLGDTPTVVRKMTAAYDVVKARGGRTALTLYYNENCWKYPTEEMFAWAEANVPARMRSGLDYVWISYYEDDCNGLQPDWPTVFQRLGRMFPSSKIGFGEIGTAQDARKAEYLERYYNLSIPEDRFVGGYFWWYFRQDMVPYTSPLWDALNSAIR